MSLNHFTDKLRGWKTSPDGEDFCPKCWEEYIDNVKKQDVDIAEMMVKDGCDTATVAETRRSRDGWFTICCKCNQEESETYVIDKAE